MGEFKVDNVFRRVILPLRPDCSHELALPGEQPWEGTGSECIQEYSSDNPGRVCLAGGASCTTQQYMNTCSCMYLYPEYRELKITRFGTPYLVILKHGLGQAHRLV